MTHIKLSHIARKSILLRIICMIMFMLIQFDTYLYEMIQAYQYQTAETITLKDDNNISIDKDCSSASWEDLTYAKASSRLGRYLSSAYLQSILYFFNVANNNTRQHTPQLVSNHLTRKCIHCYVIHCSLLI